MSEDKEVVCQKCGAGIKVIFYQDCKPISCPDCGAVIQEKCED